MGTFPPETAFDVMHDEAWKRFRRKRPSNSWHGNVSAGNGLTICMLLFFFFLVLVFFFFPFSLFHFFFSSFYIFLKFFFLCFWFLFFSFLSFLFFVQKVSFRRCRSPRANHIAHFPLHFLTVAQNLFLIKYIPFVLKFLFCHAST